MSLKFWLSYGLVLATILLAIGWRYNEINIGYFWAAWVLGMIAMLAILIPTPETRKGDGHGPYIDPL